MQSRQPGRGPPEPEKQPRSAAAAAAPSKSRGEGKVGRQTAAGEVGDTHPPRQQPTGRGGWGPGLSLGRKGRCSFRNAADAREAAAAAAPGRRLPPLLCFDSTDHVTLSHETRICRLPRAAAQQIAAARDPAAGPPRMRAPRACPVGPGRRPRASRGPRGAGPRVAVPVGGWGAASRAGGRGPRLLKGPA